MRAALRIVAELLVERPTEVDGDIAPELHARPRAVHEADPVSPTAQCDLFDVVSISAMGNVGVVWVRYAVLARFPRARATRWAHAARLFPADPETREFLRYARTFRGRGQKRVATVASSAPDAFFLARGDSYLDAILSLNTTS